MEFNVFEVKDFCEKNGYYVDLAREGAKVKVVFKKEKGVVERPCSICPKYVYSSDLDNYSCSSWSCICE